MEKKTPMIHIVKIPKPMLPRWKKNKHKKNYNLFQFSIIEFDPETFRILLDYLHTGSCPLTCASIPGLICAAEHYDLPELLQACFHHAKQFLRIEVVRAFGGMLWLGLLWVLLMLSTNSGV